MIRILIEKSIKYQVSWYILGTLSVSVSLIHFRCISIINHWYMTVIHLLGTQNSLLTKFAISVVNSSSRCPWVEFGFLTMLPTDKSWSWRRFLRLRHNIVNWLSSQFCRQGMYQLLEWHWTEHADRIQSNPKSFHQIQHNSIIVCTRYKTVQHGWTDRSVTSVTPHPYLSDSMFEKLCYWKQTTDCFRTVSYWHCYLFFHVIAFILQLTFWCKLYGKLLYYCACIFLCLLTTYIHSFNFGACWGFQKYQQSIMNHDTFKMYQYHDTI